MSQTLQNRPMGIKPRCNGNLTSSRTKLVIMDVPQLTYLGENLADVYQKHVKGMFTEVSLVTENKSWKQPK